MTKKDAHRLVDSMPEDFSWDDLMDEIYVCQVIEKGLDDSESGRTKDVSEIRAKYGLSE